MQRGQKSLNAFKFETSRGRFPSDGSASMAVKGLIFLKSKSRQTIGCQLLYAVGYTVTVSPAAVLNYFIYLFIDSLKIQIETGSRLFQTVYECLYKTTPHPLPTLILR